MTEKFMVGPHEITITTENVRGAVGVGHRDPRGPMGRRGARNQARSFEEFLGFAIKSLTDAYDNTFAFPQEFGHAYADMKEACADILEDYEELLKNLKVQG